MEELNLRLSELGAYGKLPFYRDFLRVRCFDGPAGRFKAWIDSGFDRLSRSRSPAIGGPWRWILFTPQYRELLAGLLVDSHDGMRRFPFSCFARVQASGNTCPAEALVALRGLWEELGRFYETALEQPDAQSFRSFVESWTPPDIAGSDTRDTPATSLKQFADTLWGPDGMARLPAFLWSLRQDLQNLRQASGRSGTPPGLRLPMGDDLDALEQAAIWLQLLETNGFPKDANRQAWSVFAPSVARRGWLLFFEREPEPADLSGLAAAPPTAPAGDPSQAIGYGMFRNEVESTLLSDHATLADLARFRIL